MSRYYLIANYLVPPFIRVGDGVVALGMTSGRTAPRRRRLPGPKNFMICRLDASTSVRVVYYDWERGLLMITAPSRQRAYDVGEAVNGYFSAFLGYEQDPSRTSFWLRECERLPKADWSEKTLLENLPHLESKEPEHELHELQSGFGLDYHHVDLLGRYLPALTESPRLVNALLHFRQSRQLFAGFMVGSYYHSHYRHDRKEAPRWLMEKRYYESRAQYELGFLSAFKAIESFFDTPMLRRNNVDAAFRHLPFQTITPDKRYVRKHEVFSRFPARTTYRDLVLHFLAIRNAVAAHANPSPPKRLILSEDNLFEIQLFVTHLVGNAIEAIIPDRTKPAVDPNQFPDASEVITWV